MGDIYNALEGTTLVSRMLQDAGAPEPLAVATVGVIGDATSELVTRDVLRAEINHALLIFGGVMISTNIGIAALTLAAMKLFFF